MFELNLFNIFKKTVKQSSCALAESKIEINPELEREAKLLKQNIEELKKVDQPPNTTMVFDREEISKRREKLKEDIEWLKKVNQPRLQERKIYEENNYKIYINKQLACVATGIATGIAGAVSLYYLFKYGRYF